MINEDDKTIAEKYRGFTNKAALKAIYKIYDAHEGTTHAGCWCSSLEREKKAKEFYTWFDSKILQEALANQQKKKNDN